MNQPHLILLHHGQSRELAAFEIESFLVIVQVSQNNPLFFNNFQDWICTNWTIMEDLWSNDECRDYNIVLKPNNPGDLADLAS